MAHFPSFRLPLLSHPVSYSAKQTENLACPVLLNEMRGELGPDSTVEKTSLSLSFYIYIHTSRLARSGINVVPIDGIGNVRESGDI